MSIRIAAITFPALAVAALALSHAAPAGNKHDGQYIFRFDTFGNEDLWTDTLRLHEVIQSAVSPETALSVGLKVDATVLPPKFLATADLKSPATTVELLRRNAVVGVVAKVEDRRITSIGITAEKTCEWPSSCCRPSPFSVVRPAVAPSRKPRARWSAAAQARSPIRCMPNME